MTQRPEIDLAEKAQQIRRRRDISLILPLLGILVFFSPLIRIADVGTGLFGIPPVIVYLFGFWLVIIWATRRLARRLNQDDPE